MPETIESEVPMASQATKKRNERTEDQFKAATHRAKHAALVAANNSVIALETNSNTSNERLDKLAHTDTDSLLNACVSAKGYIKSKYGASEQSYKNIAKKRFDIPTRFRKKR